MRVSCIITLCMIYVCSHLSAKSATAAVSVVELDSDRC